MEHRVKDSVDEVEVARGEEMEKRVRGSVVEANGEEVETGKEDEVEDRKKRGWGWGRGRASTSRCKLNGVVFFFFFFFFSLSLSLSLHFLTCCRSLAALAMTLPYMAEFIVDSNLSLFCLLAECVWERERERLSIGRRIFLIVSVLFFSPRSRFSLSLSLSRARARATSLIEQAHHVIHDGQRLRGDARRKEKRAGRTRGGEEK